jgi:trimeric autotransporter adhesin
MTYEKGLFAQADPGIVSGSTIERKKMSTKTIYKRIALVAVTALGAGVLSVAPANAAVLPNGTATAITLSAVTTTPTVGAAVELKMGTTVAALVATTTADTLTFQAAVTSYPAGGSVSAAGVLAANQTPAGTATPLVASAGTAPVTSVVAGGNLRVTTAADTAWSAQTVAYLGGFRFTPTKAGVHVVTVWNDTDVDGTIDPVEVSQTVSITVVAASGLSTSLSTAYMAAAATAADFATAPGVANLSSVTFTSTTDAVARTAAKGTGAATNALATIEVILKNADGTVSNGHTVSATVSGSGLIAVGTADNTNAAGTKRADSAVLADNVGYVEVSTDGTSGIGTITISVTDVVTGATTVIGTKTVTSYGAVTKIVATGVMTIGRAGGATTGVAVADRDLATEVPAVIIKATDASGYVVPSLTITAVSSDVVKVNSAITVAGDVASAANIYSSGGTGFYNVSISTPSSAKSGDKATLTFRTPDPADPLGLAYLTSAVEITVGGSVATEVLSFDKTSYIQGESMIVTVTAKDSSGNPVYDGAASPAITFSKAVGGTSPAASVYVGGKKSNAANTVFAPVTPGAFSALATSGNAAASAITAASTVADANAALTTLVNSLIAKINALNKLVIKIQKKVRA